MTDLLILAAVMLGLTWWLGREDSRRVQSAPAPDPPLARWAIGIALAAGVLVRLWGVDRSLWTDEFGSYWVASGPFSDVIRRTQTFQGQGPLYYLLLWPFAHGFVQAEWFVRLPSLIAGGLSTVAVYYTGRSLGAARLAWTAAILHGLAMFCVKVTTDVRPYALGMAFGALALLGFVGVVRRGGWKHRAAFILGGAGLVHAHYVLALGLLGLGVAYLLSGELRRAYPIRQFSTDVAIQGLLVSPLAWDILRMWERRGVMQPPGGPEYTSFVFVLGPLLFLIVAGLVAGRRGSAPAGGLGPELALAGFALAQVGGLFALTLVGVNLLPARFLVSAIAPCALLAALALERIPRSVRLFPWAYWLIFTGTLYISTFLTTGSFSGAGYQDFRGGVAALRDRVPDGAATPVLFRSGLIEDDIVPSGVDAPHYDPSLAQAFLQSPGAPKPDWNVVMLSFRWRLPGRAEYFAREVVPAVEGAREFFYLSCNCQSDPADGAYEGKLMTWIEEQFPGMYRVQSIPAGRGMVLLRFQRQQ